MRAARPRSPTHMRLLRPTLGILAAVVMIGSGIIHATVGWPALSSALARFQVDAETMRGLRLPWYLASLCMIGYGLVALRHFVAMARGRARDALPVRMLGVLYALIGAWALAAVAMHPFFLSFLLPGAVLALGAQDARSSSSP